MINVVIPIIVNTIPPEIYSHTNESLLSSSFGAAVGLEVIRWFWFSVALTVLVGDEVTSSVCVIKGVVSGKVAVLIGVGCVCVFLSQDMPS